MGRDSLNTPGHAVLNLALVGDREDRSLDLAVVAGALLPDLPMMGFYLWTRLVQGLPERVIWSEAYFRPGWQALFDFFNSAPFVLVLLWVAYRAEWLAVRAFSASMLLHFALDLPLHHSDGHRHFFPLSDFRFESPVSYWDPGHFGDVVGALEVALVLGLSIFVLLPRLRTWPWRVGLVMANIYYVAVGIWAAYAWS